MPEADILKIRQQFPTLSTSVNGEPLVYFDNAATTQKPEAVIRCIDDYYRRTNANVHRASHYLSAMATTRFEQARECVANYLNAQSSKEIIWTRGTTEAINLIANSWGDSLQAGDEIMLSTLEHHANIVPWQLLANRTGAVIKVIPLLENGDLDLNSYAQQLSERTRLVAITHVSNALGTINPLKTIIKQAHQYGALVLVDGAQALPHLRVDLQKLGADFYVFSGHKLYAPTGIGVLYGKEEILTALPPWQGGGEMIKEVSFSGTTFNDLPFKFEAGTPNISGAIALAEAINWLQAQDHQCLYDHESALLHYALEGCQGIKGFQRIGAPEKTVSMLSFMIHGVHQQDIGTQLDHKGIAVRNGHHCAMPLMEALKVPGTTRASFSFYNTFQEIDRFIQALDEISQPFSLPVNISEIKLTGLYERLITLKGWNERYREIMLAGKQHTPLEQHDKQPQYLVKGCESDTWLITKLNKNGQYQFKADSDARIIRGLLVLVLDIFNNKTAKQIKRIDIDLLFRELELERHLSPSRGNGLRAVINKIYQVADQA